MIEAAGAPVTMISVGSGDCVFLEANQLQADKQANVTNSKTLIRHPQASLRRHNSITQRRGQPPPALLAAGNGLKRSARLQRSTCCRRNHYTYTIEYYSNSIVSVACRSRRAHPASESQ